MTDLVTDDPAAPNIGRTAALGAAIGFLLVTVGITVAGTLAGMQPGSAFGLGAFVGAWGGAGFGFMMGGTIPLARHLEHPHHRDRHPGPGEQRDSHDEPAGTSTGPRRPDPSRDLPARRGG